MHVDPGVCPGVLEAEISLEQVKELHFPRQRNDTVKLRLDKKKTRFRESFPVSYHSA
jgi:hypothetical protein